MNLRTLLSVIVLSCSAHIFTIDDNSTQIANAAIIKCSICKKQVRKSTGGVQKACHPECMKQLQFCKAVTNNPVPKTGKPWESK